MQSDVRRHVFLVDDEPDTRLVIGKVLRDLSLEVTCFSTGRDCLGQLRIKTCNLLITDLKMPDMDGIDLLRKVKQMLPLLPVIVITGYGDVPIAVKSLRSGASEFIEKPLEMQSFRSIVQSLLARADKTNLAEPQTLTKTEAKVLGLILDGKGNKEIARLMSRSLRTIEDHRSHIMKKLSVDNAVDLVKRFAVVKLPDLGQEEEQ